MVLSGQCERATKIRAARELWPQVEATRRFVNLANAKAAQKARTNVRIFSLSSTTGTLISCKAIGMPAASHYCCRLECGRIWANAGISSFFSGRFSHTAEPAALSTQMDR